MKKIDDYFDAITATIDGYGDAAKLVEPFRNQLEFCRQHCAGIPAAPEKLLYLDTEFRALGSSSALAALPDSGKAVLDVLRAARLDVKDLLEELAQKKDARSENAPPAAAGAGAPSVIDKIAGAIGGLFQSKSNLINAAAERLRPSMDTNFAGSAVASGQDEPADEPAQAVAAPVSVDPGSVLNALQRSAKDCIDNLTAGIAGDSLQEFERMEHSLNAIASDDAVLQGLDEEAADALSALAHKAGDSLGKVVKKAEEDASDDEQIKKIQEIAKRIADNLMNFIKKLTAGPEASASRPSM